MGVTLQERHGTGIRLPSGTETAEATAILLGSRSETDGSNPFPSSRQSVSRQIFPSGIEKSAVAAVCAGPTR